MTIFVLGLVIGVVVVWLVMRNRTNIKAIECSESEKEKGKQQIMNLLQEKGKIVNDEVQQLLGVSNTTTYRYLEELEKEGKIVQVGKTGRSVYYEKT